MPAAATLANRFGQPSPWIGPAVACLLLPVLVAVLGIDWAAAASDTSDLARMQGVWTLEWVEMPDGKRQGESARGKLIIVGHRVTIEVAIDGQQQRSQYLLESLPSQAPPGFDVIWPDRAPTRGIYHFDGQRLLRCHGYPGGPRPTSFEAGPAAPGNILSSWKRAPEASTELDAEDDTMAVR